MERVIEIVNYVMKQVLVHRDNSYSERDLFDTLLQLGYHPDEIEVAFKLLYLLPGSFKTDIEDVSLLSDSNSGYRCLSPTEQKKLSTACQGMLIRLVNNALVTMAEVEMILAEAVRMEHPEIGIRELELILHKVISDEERLLLILPPSSDTGISFFLN